VVKPDQGQVSGTFGTLWIQDYFYGLNFQKPNHFNQSFTVLLPQSHGITTELLKDATKKLANHHDILRCVFKDRQHLCTSSEEAPVEVLDKRDAVFDEETLTEHQSSLDIASGPLWKVILHSGNKLWMIFHHLIIDAVSWRIIAEDMRTFLTGQHIGLKTCSYKQWIEHMNGYAEKHGDKQIPFWKNMVGTNSNLPFAARTKEPILMTLRLGPSHTSKLLTNSHRAYNTEINDLLLAALARSMVTISGNSQNLVNLEGIGRMSDEVDVSRTVGWFTTMYPLSLNGTGKLENLISNTKETLRSVPDKGLGFAALVRSGSILNELAPVVFNYLGQLGSAGEAREWAIAVDEETGKEIADENHSSRYTLEVNGEVNMATGELVLGIRSFLGEGITKKFHDTFADTLVQIVEHTCSIDVPRKTPSDYSVPGMTVEWLNNIKSKFPGHEIEAIYTATGLQQTFVAHAVSHPDDDAYCVQLVFDVLCQFDPTSYQRAWDNVIQRFPAMRCAFNWSGPLPVMIILQDVSMPKLMFVDLTETGQTLEEVRMADRFIGFDLGKPCPLRVTVVRKSNGEQVILVSVHHAIVDGWSVPILLDALNTAYAEEKAGKTPDIKLDKAFFAAQEHRTQTMAEARKYWGNLDFGSPNDLRHLLNEKFAKAKSISALDKPADLEITMDPDSFQLLKTTCRTHGLTINVATQFAWHKLLQMYTGDKMTVVGTVDSGRDKPIDNINSSVGLFINTLPLLVEWKTSASTLTILQQLQNRIIDMGTYSQMPVSEIMAKASPGETLFHTISVFENYPDGGEDSTGTFALQNVVEKLDVPLGLVAYEEGGELLLQLKYNMAWLSESRAGELLMQVSRILQFVASKPEAPHEDAGAAAVSQEEQRLVIEDWNDNAAPYHSEMTVHQRFEKTVAEMPDAVALEFKDEKITYRDLNSRANRMAKMIRAFAPQIDHNRNSFVALYLDRDANMLIAMLAVLKAGAAYVPIVPDNATERCQIILEDASPLLVLTNHHHTKKLKAWTDLPMLPVESVPEILPGENLTNVSCAPTDLAYAIYTSGTTGKPKACMIEHHNVQYIADAQEKYTHGEDVKRTLFFAAYVFDATTFEVYRSLFTGCTVVMAPEEIRADSRRLGDFILNQNIDFVFITPKLAELVEPSKFSCVKQLTIGGEAPSLELFLNVSKYAKQCWNILGPTECSAVCVGHRFLPGDSPSNIGRPFPNAYAYILDEQQKPVPLGAPGELYVGGVCVGRGYMNRPELTAEKFLPNPFHPGRMYGTGDVCRYFPNGDLEFLGRKDRQVKIRGNRIELTDVESAIQKLPGVEHAVVIDIVQGKRKSLAAYVVGSVNMKTSWHQLSARLPSYMMPSSFTSIEKVPVNVNGKLDRTALPDPSVSSLSTSSMISEPRTPLEKQLCGIFADVLDLEAVGITDDFFANGGNSISAVDLVYKLQAAGIGDLRAKDIYKVPTVTGIVKLVQGDAASVDAEPSTRERRVSLRVSVKGGLAVTSGLDALQFDLSEEAEEAFLTSEGEFETTNGTDRTNSFELLPIQESFRELQLPNQDQCEAFTLCLPEDHDYAVDEIEEALEEIQKNHGMLRSTLDGDKLTVRSAGEVPLSFQDMRENEVPEKVLEQLFQNIDVKDGPVWHVVLHSGFKLFVVIHQLFSDVVSRSVIAEDLCSVLHGNELKQEPCTYGKWGDYVRDYGQMNAASQAPFWNKMVGSVNRSLTPAKSKPDTVQITIPEDISTALMSNNAEKEGNKSTENLLLASLGRALSSITGGGSSSVSLASLSRMQKDINVARTVGCFYNSFPVLLPGAGSVRDTLKKVKKVLNCIPDQGIGYQTMVQTGDVSNAKPQVQLTLVDDLRTSCFLEPGWSVVPFPASDTCTHALGVNDPNLALCVLSSVHVETGILGLTVQSRLSTEKTSAFCEALEDSLQDTAKYLSKKTQKPLRLFRKKGLWSKLRPKKRPQDKALRASRIVRNFADSVMENEYMFFIHPGGSDAAVYRKVADELAICGFNPKGIDNDVLLPFKKYEMAKDLGELARFYASLVVSSMKKAKNGAPIKLFGWSLGGKIALETALILEKQGHKKVYVYLLDSFLNLSSLGFDHKALVEETMDEFLSTRRKSLVDSEMFETHKNVVDSEYTLAEQPLSGKLKHSKVVLFKAGKALDVANEMTNELMQHAVESYDNGLSMCARKFTVITLKEYDHNNIIDAHEKIIEVIVEHKFQAAAGKDSR